MRNIKLAPGKQPTRASPPWCWVCSRQLACGGWQYRTVLGPDGNRHPVHADCAKGLQVVET